MTAELDSMHKATHFCIEVNSQVVISNVLIFNRYKCASNFSLEKEKSVNGYRTTL